MGVLSESEREAVLAEAEAELIEMEEVDDISDGDLGYENADGNRGRQ